MGREGLRKTARDRYKTQLKSPFSYCGLCGTMLVWRSLLNKDHTYHYKGDFTAVVTTPHGLKRVHVGTVDHIVRLAEGGTNDLSNLAGLCVPCHREKDEQKPIPRYCWICEEELEPRSIRCSHAECNLEDRRLKTPLAELMAWSALD